MIRYLVLAASLFMILLVIAPAAGFSQEERNATVGVLGFGTMSNGSQYANLMDIKERDPKTKYHYMYRLFCEGKCPLEDGMTYPAIIKYDNTFVAQITYGKYQLKVGTIMTAGARLYSDGRAYECETPIEGGHWERDGNAGGLACKPGKNDNIKWKTAKPTGTYGPCNEQTGFADITLKVVITVKTRDDMVWKFDEAPAVIAKRILEGLNKNSSNIIFQEASGVTPNLFLAVTAVETNEGTRQASMYVEATGLGKSGVLFKESSGTAPFTDWAQAADKLTANMNIYLRNGLSVPPPCINADGFLRLP